MTDKQKSKRQSKYEEKPEEDSFGLDIGFEEALDRFLNVDPRELNEEQKPPQKPKDES